MAALFRFPLLSSGSSPASPLTSSPNANVNAGSVPPPSGSGSAPKEEDSLREKDERGGEPPRVPPKSARREADLVSQREREADLLAGRSYTPPISARRRPAPHLPAPLWALILSFSSSSAPLTSAGDHTRDGDIVPRMSEGLTEADAASVARVCRAACEGRGGGCMACVILLRSVGSAMGVRLRVVTIRAEMEKQEHEKAIQG
ncbi:hypothetical protein C8R44DRAFT_979218 [Mycena epipterygia]|nr:hypothetical protein C8R44DRAFT_979218 [Mycena epipterygia]